MGFFSSFKKISLKYRRLLFFIFILWGLWNFGLGVLGGWFFTKGGLDKFPEIKKEDRILVLAPHIDDEAIGAGGLILESINNKARVKIVYLTNGDNNLTGAIKEEKTLKLTPEEFVKLGQERMNEGKKATAILGLKDEDLIFLGYPDRGLKPMLGKYYSENNPIFSQGTKFNHNPYLETLKPGRLYAGENLVTDLKEILNDFKPTIVLVSHPRDFHQDHQACFIFLKRALEETDIKPRIFAYLIHYPLYPQKKKLEMNSFLYPPKKLFSQRGWFSFELTYNQENQKLEAIKQYKSQVNKLDNFLFSFVKRNEIFEELEWLLEIP